MTLEDEDAEVAATNFHRLVHYLVIPFTSTPHPAANDLALHFSCGREMLGR